MDYSAQIDVTGPKDVVAAFNFVKKTKTRLVIKNTGVRSIPCTTNG